MIVAQSVLETASRVDLEPVLLGQQTDPNDGPVLTHFVRSDRPQRERIVLRWEAAPAPMAQAIGEHYRANVGAFQFRLRDGSVWHTTYAEPPAFNPRNHAAVDVIVVLERALDID